MPERIAESSREAAPRRCEARGAAKPKKTKTLASTICSLFQKDISDKEVSTILQRLEADGVLTIEGVKVSYA